MAFTGTDVSTRISHALNDAASKRWTNDERLLWINDALAEIVIRRPAAGETTATLVCAAGTKQVIPSDGVMLMDVARNINANDSVGRSIRLCDRQLLDDQDPNWHAGTQKSAAIHYTFDERTPTQFYVYPPLLVGTKISIVYSAVPAKIASLADTIGLKDWYLPAVSSYVLWRCYLKDSEYANGTMAAVQYQAFLEALGVQNQMNAAASPNGASV